MNSITRVFTKTDQEKFADWSADWNPLHVNPVWASTVYPGQVVVHGMHTVLWLLNQITTTQSITKLSVIFVRPILLGDVVEAKLTHNATGLTAIAQVRDKVMTRVTVEFGSKRIPSTQKAVTTTAKLPTAPQSLLLEELPGRKGTIGLPKAAPLIKAFPHVHKIIGDSALRGLAGLSTLVGMECPGLHAVFSEFSLKMQTEKYSDLSYSVAQIDQRFSRVSMTVDCSAFVGSVTATVATPDIAPDIESIDTLVGKNEFATQEPLIIGGGSGLGAVSAKLLARGGATPIITVNQALDAGQRVKQEISAVGGHCKLLQFDVTNPNKGLHALSDSGWNGGQIYYFASPRIFRRRLEAYQDNDLKDFMQIYVSSFYEVIRAIQKLTHNAPLKIFYPSSVAVESFPSDMFEYALAKHAGEKLCYALGRELTSIQTIVERLPRIDSRQTRSFLKVAAIRPADIMLPILRRMNP